MASTKKGTLTGSSLERKTGKGTLTGSKRLLTNPVAENVAENIVSSAEVQQADTNARAKVAARFSQNPVQAATGIDLGSLGKLDTTSLLGSDPFAADCQIPEQSASESNSHLLRIQRQENSLSVAIAKAKLQQNVIQLGIENQKLVGLGFDYKSEGVNTQTKGIQFERSHVRLDLETSKLNQDREFLVHQNIATEGTQSLTNLVREEWQLRIELTQKKNERLRIEIQSAQQDNSHKLASIEAKLALVSGF